MNEEILNMSLRKFLKKVGISSQREIESAVRAAEGGDLPAAIDAKVTLSVPSLGLNVDIDGKIETK